MCIERQTTITLHMLTVVKTQPTIWWQTRQSHDCKHKNRKVGRLHYQSNYFQNTLSYKTSERKKKDDKFQFILKLCIYIYMHITMPTQRQNLLGSASYTTLICVTIAVKSQQSIWVPFLPQWNISITNMIIKERFCRLVPL